MLLTIGEALVKATESLRARGFDSPRLDAEVLLGFVLGKTRTDLYMHIDQKLTGPELDKYFQMIERRLTGEPVAYITGEKEFMSLMFKVNASVLIPRPETELLVEEALALRPQRILDVGTGSGAIAVSLAYYLPLCRVWAVDISEEALQVAKCNSYRHGVADKIAFYRGNLTAPLPVELNGSFDLVAANLPYIPTPEMENLPVDVRDYEPKGALDGGDDGLSFYRELCPGAYRLLGAGGVMLAEIGYDQASEMRRIMAEAGFIRFEIKKDLAGLDRLVKAYK